MVSEREADVMQVELPMHPALPPMQSGSKLAGMPRRIEGPETDWGKRSEGYVNTGWVTHRELLLSILDAAHLSRQHIVLDIGGGGGIEGTEAARRVKRVDVIDLFRPMLNLARMTFSERTGANGEDLRLLQADAVRLPYASNSVDRTLMRMVLHHVDDPQSVIEEAVRVTKPGGLVVISEGTPPSIEPQVITDYAEVFSLKERRRIIYDSDIAHCLMFAGVQTVSKQEFWIRDASIMAWLVNSGLSELVQKAIFDRKLYQSEASRRAYGTRYVLKDGTLVRELPKDLTRVVDIIEAWRFVTVVGEK